MLWVLKHGAEHGLDIAAMPELPRPGLTSLPANAATPDAFYRVAGFHVCGPRAVRVDMLERLGGPDPPAAHLAARSRQPERCRRRARPATAASRRRPT